MPKGSASEVSSHASELLETRLNIMQRTIEAQGKELARLTSHSSYFERMIGYLLKEIGYKLPKLGEKVVSRGRDDAQGLEK